MDYKALLEQMGITVIDVVQYYKPTIIFYLIVIGIAIIAGTIILNLCLWLVNELETIGLFLAIFICVIICSILLEFGIDEPSVLNSASAFSREDYQTYLI